MIVIVCVDLNPPVDPIVPHSTFRLGRCRINSVASARRVIWKSRLRERACVEVQRSLKCPTRLANSIRHMTRRDACCTQCCSDVITCYICCDANAALCKLLLACVSVSLSRLCVCHAFIRSVPHNPESNQMKLGESELVNILKCALGGCNT